MFITKTNNTDLNFKGIKLHNMSRNSKTGKYLLEASKQPEIATQISALEKKGMIFDFVNPAGHEGQKTDLVSFFLGRTPYYFTKNGKNPLFTERKVTTSDEAKTFVAEVVKKAKDFLPTHLKKIEEYNKIFNS